MRPPTIVRIILLTAICCVSQALASTVTIDYLHNSGVYQGGYAGGPRSVLIDSIPAELVCNDFIGDVTAGQIFTANVSMFDSLTSVRFQQATPAATLQLYDEAGFLYDQILASPSTEWGNLQFALWAVFDPAVESQPGFTTTGVTPSSYWLNLAQQQTYTPGEFSNVLIYTPTNGSTQELLGSVTTPEPGSLAMLGAGLALFGLIYRRVRPAPAS